MTPPPAWPLRAALSVPAIVALLLQQIGRVASPPMLLWWVLFELAFVAAAFSVARRSPEASWAWVPVLWLGAALGAAVDALLLDGRPSGILPLVSFAAPALVVGFVLARAFPKQVSRGGAQIAPPRGPEDPQ